MNVAGHLDRWWLGTWQVLALAALGCAITWLLLCWPTDTPVQRGLRALLPLCTVALAAHGLHAARQLQAWQLRWDGQQWWLLAGPVGTATPATGNIQVRIDLGAWMLLRFAPQPPAVGWRPSGTTWLPLRRTQHRAHWHALRCAVYSPRPSTPATTP